MQTLMQMLMASAHQQRQSPAQVQQQLQQQAQLQQALPAAVGLRPPAAAQGLAAAQCWTQEQRSWLNISSRTSSRRRHRSSSSSAV
jgi:hypothetical protein